MAGLEDQIKALQEENATLRSQISEPDLKAFEQIRELRAANAKLKDEVRKLTSESVQVAFRQRELEGQLKEARESIEAHKSQELQLGENLRSAEHSIEELRGHKGQLETELHEHKTELGAKKSLVIEHEAELARQKNELERRQDDLEKLQDELGHREGRIKNLENLVNELKVQFLSGEMVATSAAEGPAYTLLTTRLEELLGFSGVAMVEQVFELSRASLDTTDLDTLEDVFESLQDTAAKLVPDEETRAKVQAVLEECWEEISSGRPRSAEKVAPPKSKPASQTEAVASEAASLAGVAAAGDPGDPASALLASAMNAMAESATEARPAEDDEGEEEKAEEPEEEAAAEEPEEEDEEEATEDEESAEEESADEVDADDEESDEDEDSEEVEADDEESEEEDAEEEEEADEEEVADEEEEEEEEAEEAPAAEGNLDAALAAAGSPAERKLLLIEAALDEDDVDLLLKADDVDAITDRDGELAYQLARRLSPATDITDYVLDYMGSEAHAGLFDDLARCGQKNSALAPVADAIVTLAKSPRTQAVTVEGRAGLAARSASRDLIAQIGDPDEEELVETLLDTWIPKSGLKLPLPSDSFARRRESAAPAAFVGTLRQALRNVDYTMFDFHQLEVLSYDGDEQFLVDAAAEPNLTLLFHKKVDELPPEELRFLVFRRLVQMYRRYTTLAQMAEGFDDEARTVLVKTAVREGVEDLPEELLEEAEDLPAAADRETLEALLKRCYAASNDERYLNLRDYLYDNRLMERRLDPIADRFAARVVGLTTASYAMLREELSPELLEKAESSGLRALYDTEEDLTHLRLRLQRLWLGPLEDKLA